MKKKVEVMCGSFLARLPRKVKANFLRVKGVPMGYGKRLENSVGETASIETFVVSNRLSIHAD